MTSADLPFVLQGLNAPSFRWNNDFTLAVIPELPAGSAALLNLLLEPAILYQKIRNLRFPEGLLYQALDDCVDTQLQKYRVLLGGLERRANDSSAGEFSLLACYDMLYDAVKGLRSLHAILSYLKRNSGSHLFKALRPFTRHGDPYVCVFAQQLNSRVKIPFDLILNEWLSSGILNDPFNEFFIEFGDPESIWKDRFVLNFEKLPEDITEAKAQEVYETGKSVYFLRELCQDVSLAATSVVQVLVERYDLRGHLSALHDYLLLARDDFASCLLAEALPVLDQPSDRLYRHQLVQILETAISTSNAQYEPSHITSCLDARMLELGAKEKGWQLFTLEYNVESPLDVIFDKPVSRKYLQIFNVLWSIRWASASIQQCYVTINSRSSVYNGPSKSSYDQESGYSTFECWVKQADFCQMIIQFLNELQSYIYTNVIGKSWKKLDREIATASSVDAIATAHKVYLKEIAQGALFGGGEAVGELHELVKLCSEFKFMVHQIVLVAAQRGDLSQLLLDLDTQQSRYRDLMVNLLGTLEDVSDEARSFRTRINFNEFYISEA